MLKIIMKTNNKRSGIAIPIVLAIGVIFGILVMALTFRQSTTKSQNKMRLLERQAHFAARSGMQHFLLKAKLFPTELYDAVEIKQGKNPLVNFTEFEHDPSGNFDFRAYAAAPGIYYNTKEESRRQPGDPPRYMYIKLTGKDAYIRIGSYYNPDYRFLLSGIASSDPAKKYLYPSPPPASLNAGKYLDYFIRDCASDYQDDVIQPALKIEKSSSMAGGIKKFDIAVESGYPYSLSYKVEEVKIQAIQALRKYGEEAIEIKVSGKAKNFQGKEEAQEQTKLQKIDRKGQVI